MKEVRSLNHWAIETFTQRITSKQWKAILLEEQDVIIVMGRLRHLKARNLGSGIVEIYKEKENKHD